MGPARWNARRCGDCGVTKGYYNCDVYSVQLQRSRPDGGIPPWPCNQTIDMIETQNMATIARMPVLCAVMRRSAISNLESLGLTTHLSKPCSTTWSLPDNWETMVKLLLGSNRTPSRVVSLGRNSSAVKMLREFVCCWLAKRSTLLSNSHRVGQLLVNCANSLSRIRCVDWSHCVVVKGCIGEVDISFSSTNALSGTLAFSDDAKRLVPISQLTAMTLPLPPLVEKTLQ